MGAVAFYMLLGYFVTIVILLLVVQWPIRCWRRRYQAAWQDQLVQLPDEVLDRWARDYAETGTIPAIAQYEAEQRQCGRRFRRVVLVAFSVVYASVALVTWALMLFGIDRARAVGDIPTASHVGAFAPEPQCAAGQFPVGVTAAGAVEGCLALPAPASPHPRLAPSQQGLAANRTWSLPSPTTPLPLLSAYFPLSPAPVFAQTTEGIRVLFDATTPECMAWRVRLPADARMSPTMHITYAMLSDTNTQHTLAWDVSVVPIDSGHPHGMTTTCHDPHVPGTAGHTATIRCPLPTAEHLPATMPVELRLCRNVVMGTATGDAAVHAGMLTYAADVTE